MAYSIDLSGRIAMVTGASSGLGAQFAQTLARAGAAVVLAGRRSERLKDLRARIEGEGGDAHVVALDVTQRHSIQAAVAHAETEMGSIDILINNAGVSAPQRLLDVGEADFDFVMDTNLRGAFFMAQEVARRMIARAQGAAPGSFTGGRIVNMASVAGLRALAQIGTYGMSKAALIHMTRAMALEWGRFGINVNALCPGYIDTEMNHRQAAAPAPGPGAGSGCAHRAAGERPEPLRQRRRHQRRRWHGPGVTSKMRAARALSVRVCGIKHMQTLGNKARTALIFAQQLHGVMPSAGRRARGARGAFHS
jgi:NAD(P)-dependent dehydrogenase (short-subunit alcohol dehydrogenase family)